jgi:hypothetical protein
LFFRYYADRGVSKTRTIDLFLDQYWDDLFDQAKTQYATDRIQQEAAAGTLKVHPKQNYRSLLNDEEYQDAVRDIRVRAKLEADLAESDPELVQRLQHADPNSNPEAASETGSGRVIGRGASGRDDTGGDPRHP